jgi:enediyne biosynthesis protein E4
VLLNRTTANRPLAVSVLTKAGRPAHGAEVRVTAGGRTQLRVVQPADSYLSSGTPAALFGLGAADRFDEIVVRWPDGTEQRLPGGTDKSVEVRRP